MRPIYYCKALLARLRDLVPCGDCCRGCGVEVDADHWQQGNLCHTCYYHRQLVAHPHYQSAKRMAKQVVASYNESADGHATVPIAVDDYAIGVCLGIIKNDDIACATDLHRVLGNHHVALLIIAQDQQFCRTLSNSIEKLAVQP